MRKLYTLLSTVLLSATAFAQLPQKMSYQSVIRNSSNQLVTSHGVGMRVSILQGSATGTAVYVETQTPTTNANGLVTIEIGNGTPVFGTFAGINWFTGVYFLKTETDPNGGTSYTITGTNQLLSVPYAFYAKISESSIDAVNLFGNQSIYGNKTFTGTTSVISPVNPTDAVNKAYVDLLKSRIDDIQVQIGIEDIDANMYHLVKIGTQLWMAENLKTTKYNDGTAIPNAIDYNTWSTMTTGAYCDYNDTPANSTTYGRLYNWFTVDNNPATKLASNGGKNVCPVGWHVPTDAEWTILTDYLTNDGYGYQGSGNDIAKSMANTSDWTLSGILGTVGNDQASNNSSGFKALPGGFRNSGAYYQIGVGSIWWSSSEYSATLAYSRGINYSTCVISRNDDDKQRFGYSVRCLRDF
jgi:uncharacterized protein (TIGR02145 family)